MKINIFHDPCSYWSNEKGILHFSDYFCVVSELNIIQKNVLTIFQKRYLMSSERENAFRQNSLLKSILKPI